MAPIRATALLLTCVLLSGCTLIDVRAGHGSFNADGLIGGFADWGITSEDSLLEIAILDGDSEGSIFLLELWRIARVEVGLVGASVGLGPLHFGLGVLFYDPESPHMMDWGGGGHGHHDDHGHDHDDD